MATKTGFKYYNVDTDRYMDIRIKRLKKDMGCRGIAVYDYLLCEVYRVNGCFTVWDENTAFDVAEYFGLKESNVNEIVRYCGAVGLFDKGLLSRGIITSSAIQQRYLNMCVRAKRTATEIPEEYILFPEKHGQLPEKSSEIPETSGSFSQSRVNKSRDNISVVGVNAPAPACEGDSISFDSLITEFFKPEHAGVVEQLCMSLHTDTATLLADARTIMAEWQLRGQKLTDYKSASAHLINHLRVKANARHEGKGLPTGAIADRKKAFKAQVSQVMRDTKAMDGSQLYTPEICREFFRYWTELTPDKSRMRFETQEFWETEKRMEKWIKKMPTL